MPSGGQFSGKNSSRRPSGVKEVWTEFYKATFSEKEWKGGELAVMGSRYSEVRTGRDVVQDQTEVSYEVRLKKEI